MNFYMPNGLNSKIECVFPMVMGQHKDDDRREDAPHFIMTFEFIYEVSRVLQMTTPFKNVVALTGGNSSILST